MAKGGMDWDKLNRLERMRLNGSEAVEEPRFCGQQPKTRKEDLVKGLSKAAQDRNESDRSLVRAKNKLLANWIEAGDVSTVEIENLKRQIALLTSKLPKEKIALGKRKRSERKPRKK